MSKVFHRSFLTLHMSHTQYSTYTPTASCWKGENSGKKIWVNQRSSDGDFWNAFSVLHAKSKENRLEFA